MLTLYDLPSVYTGLISSEIFSRKKNDLERFQICSILQYFVVIYELLYF